MPKEDIEFRRVNLDEYEKRYRNMDEAREDGWSISMEYREKYKFLNVRNDRTREVLQITSRLYSLLSSLYSTGFEKGHKKGLQEAVSLLRTKKRKAKYLKNKKKV